MSKTINCRDVYGLEFEHDNDGALTMTFRDKQRWEPGAKDIRVHLERWWLPHIARHLNSFIRAEQDVVDRMRAAMKGENDDT